MPESEKDDLGQLGGKVGETLRQPITRRQAIRVGGLAALGLVFSKPLIETIRPKPAFAQYVSQPPSGGAPPVGALMGVCVSSGTLDYIFDIVTGLFASHIKIERQRITL